MLQAAKSTDRSRRQSELAKLAPAGNEPARFLRNLTSLPDADFASTYSPAIAAAFASYADLPDPNAARRALLFALKAALKRRRAFILPRFTQAEDSWRIRECASYAVAITILVEHAFALLALDRADRSADPDAWARFLADPEATPEAGESNRRAALFHTIVPAQGRRWIAREPLAQTLLAKYFTDTAPNELLDIVGPVVDGFANERQAPRYAPNDDPPPALRDAPARPPPTPPAPENRTGFLARTLSTLRAALGRGRPRQVTPERSRTDHNVSATTPADQRPPHHAVSPPHSASQGPHPEATRFPTTGSASDNRAKARSTQTPSPATTSPAPTASTETHTRCPRPSKPPRHRRNAPPVADLLHGLPAASAPHATARPRSPAARRPDIGDHGAATVRIGHAAEYAASLMSENSLRPTQQTKPFLLPGPAPDATGQPLDVDALFPARAEPLHIHVEAISAWIAFRDHLVQALRSGAQTTNGERSLVHLLEVGAFLVWPHVALPFADERRLAPTAIKSAMRAARVLAVNRADRQEDRHAFPALTGDANVTCHGLVTLPEYLWPDASLRPVKPSTLVRPPAIYGQRYRRPR